MVAPYKFPTSVTKSAGSWVGTDMIQWIIQAAQEACVPNSLAAFNVKASNAFNSVSHYTNRPPVQPEHAPLVPPKRPSVFRAVQMLVERRLCPRRSVQRTPV